MQFFKVMDTFKSIQKGHRSKSTKMSSTSGIRTRSYDVERTYCEARMGGSSSMEKLRELGLNLPNEFIAFPVVLLDEVAII